MTNAPSQLLTFRAATAADADRVVQLVQSAYRGDASRVGWTTEADLLEGQRTDAAAVGAAIATADSIVLLAERGGALVSCCHLERRGDRSYFGMFAVDPALQGAGVGKQVIEQAEEFARATWSSAHLEMTVIHQRADLIAFYVRRGYRDTGIRSPFPYGDERFGVPQRDDLEFTLLEKEIAPRA